jgi:hypothetical protein
MLDENESLVTAVKTRLDQEGSSRQILSEEILEAIRLADMFPDVKPEPYILPLDALAGYSPKMK